MVARFSHDDPRYKKALREMATRLKKLLEARDWTSADLVRAASLHMPIDPETDKPGRYGADTVSNMLNAKRRPTRAILNATLAALGIEEPDLMPDFLRDEIGGEALKKEPILTEVPGRPGFYRVVIDEELPMDHALAIVQAHGRRAGKES